MTYPTELQLVTDRTAADVAQRNEKGTYNAADLNRVETAVAYLSAMLQQLPVLLREYGDLHSVAPGELYDIPYKVEDILVAVRTNWTIKDIPVPEELLRYITNVKTVCVALEFQHSPLPTTMQGLTISRANAIEDSLQKLYEAILEFEAYVKDLVDRTFVNFYYSGEFYGGEV